MFESLSRGPRRRSWNPFRPFGPLQGWCPVFVGAIVALVLILSGCGSAETTTNPTTPSTLVGTTGSSSDRGKTTRTTPSVSAIRYPDIGFRSRGSFDDHFRKHGHEFGDIDQATYLGYAQELRDRPLGRDTLEEVRRDRVVTRYDRTRRAFGAYNSDHTIRTYFRPNDGEAYFRRQATR